MPRPSGTGRLHVARKHLARHGLGCVRDALLVVGAIVSRFCNCGVNGNVHSDHHDERKHKRGEMFILATTTPSRHARDKSLPIDLLASLEACTAWARYTR